LDRVYKPLRIAQRLCNKDIFQSLMGGVDGLADQQFRMQRIGLGVYKLNQRTPSAPSKASMLRKSSHAESYKSLRRVAATGSG
jgi:hypothetical protein